MKNKYLFALFFSLISLSIFSQVAPLIQVSIPTPLPACNAGDSTNLLAVYPHPNQTTTYVTPPLDPVFNPSFPTTGGTLLNATADDVWSPVVNLPFSFAFYGGFYDQVIVGSNGVISFDVTDAGGYCPWAFTASVPSPALPTNAIFGVYQDTNIQMPPVTNPAVQNVNYYVLDTGVNQAPNRVFVVNFNQLPQFQCNASVGFQTSQIVIHEGTNIVDIFVFNRTPCTSWNSCSGVIGVQNSTGTVGSTPAGVNTGCWTATNDHYQIQPNGAPATVNLQWHLGAATGPTVGALNENPLNVVPPATGSQMYTAVVTYVNPDGSTFSAEESINVSVAAPLPLLDPQNLTICSSLPPPYTINIDQNAHILTGVPSPGDYVIKYYEDLNDANNDASNNITNLAGYTFSAPIPKTIFVRLEDLVTTGCSNVRAFTIDVGAPAGTIDYTPAQYCSNITAQQPINEHGLTAGGTYSAVSVPPGSTLIIDPATGAITPTGSDPANYTVNYHIPATPSCPAFDVYTPVEIITCNCTVTAIPAAAQTVCVNSPITSITYTTNNASSATISAGALPPGVTGSFAGGVYTVSGSPSTAGPYSYTVSMTSGTDPVPCTVVTNITVNPSATIALNSPAATAAQTICINTPIATISYLVGPGVTGASASGLPPGVNGVFDTGTGLFNITGTPTAAGPFPYIVQTSGGCAPNATANGTMTVRAASTLGLTSAAGTTSQTPCINTLMNNIVYTIGGSATGATVTGLPAGVSGALAGNVFTISGTPSAAGPFNYTVTTTGPCAAVALSGTITVSPVSTIALTSGAATTSQTPCINTLMNNIVYTIGGSATGATVTGLPAGVNGVLVGNDFTISGTPSAAGPFNYTVTTTGPCAAVSLGGTITVRPASTITLTSGAATTSQTPCINTLMNNIVYTIGGSATGATVTGLPAGVNGALAGNVFTISGTPSVAGPFNYTVTTTGPCAAVSLGGTITVSPSPTIALTSPAATTSQTPCINVNITNIEYLMANGATGANVTGLPAGVTAAVVGSSVIISGAPSAAGPFSYTVTTTGGCAPAASTTGTITVGLASAIALTSPAATAAQTLCINSLLTNIVYTIGGSATGATVTGLPAGVNGALAGNLFTISGTPSVSGPFNYTVTTTGPCAAVALSGTITITPASTIALTSGAATTSQTPCINTPLVNNIVYTIGGSATGATVTGLPAGVTGTLVGNDFTISGTPSVSGPFNYTVTTTGPCAAVSLSGTITPYAASTIGLTSAPGTTSQTPCINTLLTNIVYTFGGSATGATVTGLPAGVTGSVTGSNFTISGTPTVAGPFSYTVTTTGPCAAVALSGTINVSASPTITLNSGSNAQTPCINTAITNIVYLMANGATGATVTGLPAGVTSAVSGNLVTISGTPTVAGPFSYTVTTTGGCAPAATANGTITVGPLSTIALTSATANQTVCINEALAAANYIKYTIGGSATGAAVTGLPAGMSGALLGSVFTISGTPTVAGPFNYTVTTSGGCLPNVSMSGTVTVSPAATLALTSAANSDNQTICISNPTPITPIRYTIGNGATGASLATGGGGFPPGITGTFATGVFTISGTPTSAGVYNYVITTTGGCSAATLSGTITVSPNATILLTSAAASTSQSLCINGSVATITYVVGNGATGVTPAGLPAGVTGSFDTATGVYTITGNAANTGVHNYTVTTTGGCSSATLGGTITVNASATIALTSGNNNQTVCVDQEAIADIIYTVGTGATGATIVSGETPSGISGSFDAANGTFTLTGTPTQSGPFTYTIQTTGGCGNATIVGTMNVDALPVITLPQDGFICEDINGIPTTTYTLETGLTAPQYSFIWYDGAGAIIPAQNGSSYTALAPGNYSVEVTNTATGCHNTATATVSPSLPPQDVKLIASQYFTQDQVVTVVVTPSGSYEYQLDGGAWQDSNQFLSLQSGEHTVLVRDKVHCGERSGTIKIIDYPKFFTPNGDGYNDFWNIPDLNDPDQEASRIFIFDRYGKLMKEMSPKGKGWDGSLNGQPLPSDDYWFKVNYIEEGLSKEFRSHFALKR